MGGTFRAELSSAQSRSPPSEMATTASPDVAGRRPIRRVALGDREGCSRVRTLIVVAGPARALPRHFHDGLVAHAVGDKKPPRGGQTG
jgi:hypothetical protein